MYVCMLYAYSYMYAHVVWMQVCVCKVCMCMCAHRCMYGGKARVGVRYLSLSLSTLFFETRTLDLEFTDSTKQARQGAPGIHPVPTHRELQGSTQSPHPKEAPGIHPFPPTESSRDPPSLRPQGAGDPPSPCPQGAEDPPSPPPTGSSRDPPSPRPHCCCDCIHLFNMGGQNRNSCPGTVLTLPTEPFSRLT